MFVIPMIAATGVAWLIFLLALGFGVDAGHAALGAIAAVLSGAILLLTMLYRRDAAHAAAHDPLDIPGALSHTSDDLADADFATWHSFESRGRWRSGNALFVGTPDASTRSMIEDLAQAGYDVHLCPDLSAMLDMVSVTPGLADLIFVDIDRYETEDIVDELLAFRQICPAGPLVVLSSEVARDDLSTERRAIADATLRKPVFRLSLTWLLESLDDRDGADRPTRLPPSAMPR